MRRAGALLAGLALSVLMGCEGVVPSDAPPPAPRPEEPVEAAPEPSERSRALSAYYKRVEQNLLIRGLLRPEGGGPDAPFDDEALVRNFERIALAQEFTSVDPSLIADETPSALRRWTAPVRIETVFGPDVPSDVRTEDAMLIEGYVARLARITGHPIRTVRADGNFRVMILTEDERRVVGPTLRRLIPGIGKMEVETIETLDRAAYCLVITSDPDNDGVITRAVAIVRAELPDALRLSCFHEEIAQGLGLGNDSPSARPSIFNDDDEFGRLTAMDEELLRLLYAPELSPGMARDEAIPIVRDLVTRRVTPAS